MEQTGKGGNMDKTLGIYMFIRNGVYYDYPFIEAIDSALPVADQVVICECFSDKDDTFDRLQERYGNNPKVKLVRNNWVTHFEGLSSIGNYAALQLTTDWKWQLQADEVIHENSYDEIRSIIQTEDPKISAFMVHYKHMLANYETEFDFCYTELIRIAKRGSKWRLIGDACQLDGGDRQTVKDTGIQVFHYGKVHEGRVGWQKEWDFQQLFTDIGFPDPKMKEMEKQFGEQYCDYVYLFESSIKEGKVRRFEGTHPKIMAERIAQFKDGGWEQFVSKMKDGLKLQ